jgi:mannose-1-phosphate guanylyltransferase/phosphomannomutase
VARFITRNSQAGGGIHVRLSPFDSRVVDIKFFDGNGQDLSTDAERNIERIFFREDFRRVYLDEIGLISYAPNVMERYSEAFLASLNTEAIRAANPSLVVDLANSPTAQVLPPLLTRLNCRVVALNEAVDETKMSILSQEFETSLRQLGKICQVLDTAMGVRLDVGGEGVFVVDRSGEVIPGTLLAAALAIMAFKAKGGGTVAVPVSMPNTFEKVAAEYGGQVLRTKVNLQALMQAANRPDVIMASDGNASFIWPDFQPVVDGMMTIARMLEFLATQNTTLSAALAAVPPFYMARGAVDCPWEAKGTVMRLLNQQYKDRLGEQIDGVKINLSDDEWVLVWPDADRPLFHVITEAPTTERAYELLNRYERIVQSLQK